MDSRPCPTPQGQALRGNDSKTRAKGRLQGSWHRKAERPLCSAIARKAAFTFIAIMFTLAASDLLAQGPFPGQSPPAQPMGPPQTVPLPQQHPAQYAFRPDLTNPEFGECLNLEKVWKGLWQQYAQEYQRARMMNPRDPQYAQMTFYLRNLKQQLDAAWQTFSGRCVYFPENR